MPGMTFEDAQIRGNPSPVEPQASSHGKLTLQLSSAAFLRKDLTVTYSPLCLSPYNRVTESNKPINVHFNWF